MDSLERPLTSDKCIERTPKMELQEIDALSLDEQVQYWDRHALGGVRTAMEGAWNCGRVLIVKKAELNHGEWLP